MSLLRLIVRNDIVVVTFPVIKDRNLRIKLEPYLKLTPNPTIEIALCQGYESKKKPILTD